MSEYIIDWPHGDSFERCFGYPPERLMGFSIKQPIVRCVDCRFFDTRKCKSQWPFRLNGFCAWGERMGE